MTMRPKKSHERYSRFPGNKRRGAAVVEMAVVTPLLLTLLFGVIEFGWVFMVKDHQLY